MMHEQPLRDRLEPPWLPLLGLLPGPATVSLCLWALKHCQPPVDEDLDPVVQAQALVRRGGRIILALRRPRDAGDRQAVGAYQAGVAVGFYGLEHKCLPVTFTPASGSAWSEAHLHQLRRAGLAHGSAVRQRQLAARQEARGGLGAVSEACAAGPSGRSELSISSRA